MSTIGSAVFPKVDSSLSKFEFSQRMSTNLMGSLIMSTSDQEFPSMLAGFQEINFSKAEQIFRDTLGKLPPNVCIVTTGSDARGEKAPGRESPMEIIVLSDPTDEAEQGTDPTDEAEQGKKIDDSKAEEEPPPVKFSTKPSDKASPVKSVKASIARIKKMAETHAEFDSDISLKSIGGEDPLYFYPTSKKTGKPQHQVIPTRAIEVYSIFGNSEVLEKFKEKTKESIEAVSYQDLKKFNQTFYTPSLKELASCLDHTSKSSVNLESGELNYDGQRIKSVKHPFLRPVQYKVTLDLLQAVRKKKINATIFTEIPKRITDRLKYLFERGILASTKEQTDKVVQAYTKAMQWYFVSQIEFGAGNQRVVVDPAELTQVGRTIHDFVNQESILAPSLAESNPEVPPKRGDKVKRKFIAA